MQELYRSCFVARNSVRRCENYNETHVKGRKCRWRKQGREGKSKSEKRLVKKLTSPEADGLTNILKQNNTRNGTQLRDTAN